MNPKKDGASAGGFAVRTLSYKISEDRRTLTILANEAKRQELREREDVQSNDALTEVFERMVCNSELDWINPADTGDLTSAPMLGVQFFDNDKRETVILERWAFMDYQVRSVLEDLRDKGEAVFIS